MTAGDGSGDRPADTDAAASRSLVGPRALGVVLLLFGLAVLFGALQIGRVTGFRPVGPGFVPIVVGVGIVVLAAAFLVRTTVRPDEWLAERAAEESRATSWPTVAGVAGLLVAYALLLAPMGYVVATTALVPLTAWVLGSRNPLRDLAVGLAIALAVWFGFTEGLGVRLPAGLLDPIL